MTAQQPAQRLGALRELPGLGRVIDRLGDVVFQQLTGVPRRGVAQDQDGRGDTRPAQLLRLVQTGHRQIVRPQPFQPPGHRHRPVPIGVCLDQSGKFTPGGQGPQRSVVLLQAVQVDLRPGSLLQSVQSVVNLLFPD